MNTSQYFPISVATLLPSTAMGLDLYQLDGETQQFRLFRSADYPLTDGDLQRLRAKGIKRLFVPAPARERYQKHIRSLVEQHEGRSDLPASCRAGALAEVVRDVLEEGFKAPDRQQCVPMAMKLGATTAKILSGDEFTAEDLFRVLHHDYATFTHSANVGLYAGLLAKGLGMPVGQIESITTGGFLHDLGKLDIEDRILCKPGRLDESEYRVIRRHPTVGFRHLAHRSDLSRGQLLMAYQHHERIDGEGYPVGVPGEEIDPWAKVCSVVDVFEALTSFRPYRTPMTRERALALMEKESGKAFDAEILKCWMTIIRGAWHE